MDGVKILHVDDNETFLDITKRRFELIDPGIYVESVSDPEKTLEKLQDGDFDCVISDYKMPGTDGIELLTRVRDEYPDLPFIILTSQGSEEVASQAISENATDYIQKGSNREDYQLIAYRIENAVSKRKAEEEREKAFSRMEDAYFAVDNDWCFTYLDDAAEKSFNRSREELIGENIWEVFPESRETGFYERYQKAMDRQQTISFTEYYPSSDKWFSVTAYPSDTGLSVYFRDVTGEKKRERRLSNLIENVPGMVYSSQNECGWPTDYVSDACEELTGYTSEEFENRDVLWGKNIIVEEDQQRVWQEVQDGVRNGGKFSSTYRIRTAKGEQKWVRDFGRGIFNENGEVTKIEGVVSDITDRKESEQEIREMEAKYRSITEDVLDAAELGIFIIGPEFEIVWANDSIQKYFGLEREELMGEDKRKILEENLREIIRNPEGSKSFVQTITDTYENNTYMEQFECWVPANDNRKARWLEHRSQPIKTGLYKGGRIEYYSDITERKEREKELERQNDLFEKAQDIANVGAWEYDPKTDEAYFTDKLYDIYGVESGYGQDVEKDIQRFYHPEDRDTVREAVAKALEEAIPYDIEVRIIAADGAEKWVRARADPYLEDGEVVRVRGTIQDITERKTHEQKLGRQNDLFQKAQDIANVGAWEYDVQADRGYGTREVPIIHGRPPDAYFPPEDSIDQYHPDDRPKIKEAFEKAINEGETYDLELRIDNGRDQRWVRTRGDPQFDEEGNVVRVRGTIQDITDRKKREERLKEFGSIISHDLRSPLTTAKSYLDLALETGEKQDIENARETLQKMNDMVEDLQIIALETEEVEKKEVSLENVFSEAYSISDVKPSFEVDDMRLEADKTSLTRLLTNLITNSVKHNSDPVHIKVGPLEDREGFYYEDDGQGIPEEDRADIFEHGFTTSGKGYGLGMTIVKRIAEVNGWNINTGESEQGGARFEIYESGK